MVLFQKMVGVLVLAVALLNSAWNSVEFPAQELAFLCDVERVGRGEVPFTVRNSSAEFTRVQLGDGSTKLYFPVDGSQPTTPQAVEWSGAKIANHAITFWYMKMFGWRGLLHEETLRMGFSGVEPVPILKVEENIAEEFWKVFQNVAENPVGRVLLYRLLIEIRRQKEGKGELGPDHPPYARDAEEEKDKEKRNKVRTLLVKKDEDWKTDMDSGVLSFGANSSLSDHVLLPGPLKTTPVSLSKEAACFHEMLHWFFELRIPRRTVSRSTLSEPESIDINYFPQFYDDIKDIGDEWKGRDEGGEEIFDIEDMRVILGASRDTFPGYLEGDDLSENLFRISYAGKVAGENGQLKSLPFRFGHRGSFEEGDRDDPKTKIRMSAVEKSMNVLLQGVRGMGLEEVPFIKAFFEKFTQDEKVSLEKFIQGGETSLGIQEGRTSFMGRLMSRFPQGRGFLRPNSN